MAGLNIPGVSDKYKTNDLVEALMKQERLPLEREEKARDEYKLQQEAWRSINQNMSSLRDSSRSLYSYDNPFNSKLGISSDEQAITAEPSRNASFDSFKIDVIHPASADRFLSKEIDKDYKVPEGNYIFKSGDKSVNLKWKGGSVKSFVESLNKRSKDVIKASVVGVSVGKQALMIEGLQTGEANKLIFEEDALTFTQDVGMIQRVKPESTNLATAKDIKNAPTEDTIKDQVGMPQLSTDNIRFEDTTIIVPPRSSFQIKIPVEVAADPNQRIEFSVLENQVEDITKELNDVARSPELPQPGGITFQGIRVENLPSDTTLSDIPKTPVEILRPIYDENIVSLKLKNGTELPISNATGTKNEDGSKKISIQVSDYPDIDSIIVRNKNTGKELTLSAIEAFNKNSDLGYEPINPASEAADAKIKYEGITITRPTNDIDDVVPDVTLHVKNKTERTATIDIKPDTETAKEYLITFVGTYNQVMAEMNILTQNKAELINELGYLSDDEVAQYKEWLGIFEGDFTLLNGKSAMQNIIASPYNVENNDGISMLSQIGISTNADSYSGYSPSKLRGYLEINEKKLDEALENNLNEIKNIFGYDTDGDLIIDNGIAYSLDKRLQGYVQSGGIFSNKIAGLKTRIDNSERKIERLEEKLEAKEAQLKLKYTQMESTLNSLESQSNSINNTFNNKKE